MNASFASPKVRKAYNDFEAYRRDAASGAADEHDAYWAEVEAFAEIVGPLIDAGAPEGKQS